MSWLQEERRAAVLLALGIGAALVILWTLLGLLPRVPQATTPVSVSLTIEALNWNLSYETETSNRTVLALLLEAADVHGFVVEWTYSDVYQAAYVHAINGIRDGQQGQYWQYWVNGVYGGVAADRYILEDGDHVVWQHTYSREG